MLLVGIDSSRAHRSVRYQDEAKVHGTAGHWTAVASLRCEDDPSRQDRSATDTASPVSPAEAYVPWSKQALRSFTSPRGGERTCQCEC